MSESITKDEQFQRLLEDPLTAAAIATLPVGPACRAPLKAIAEAVSADGIPCDVEDVRRVLAAAAAIVRVHLSDAGEMYHWAPTPPELEAVLHAYAKVVGT